MTYFRNLRHTFLQGAGLKRHSKSWPLIVYAILFIVTVSFFTCVFMLLIKAITLSKKQTSPFEIGLEDFSMEYIEEEDVRKALLGVDDITGDLKTRIQELLRIKHSVQMELRVLESKRSIMHTQINSFGRKIEELRSVANREQTELDRLKVSIHQAKLAQTEFIERNTPEIRSPLSLKATIEAGYFLEPPSHHDSECFSFERCFDFARCSLTSGFPIYFYNNPLDISSATTKPDEACLFVVFSGEDFDSNDLSHWNGDGRNHLIIDTEGTLNSIKPSRAIIASTFEANLSLFRSNFDMVLSYSYDHSRLLPNLVPIRRKYLISDFHWKSDVIVKELSAITDDDTDDKAYINGSENSNSKTKILDESTFTIIRRDPNFQRNLFDALIHATIPVVIYDDDDAIGVRRKYFPYSEFVDWDSASVLLPIQRLPELHFFLRSFPDSDLFHLKRQGRLIFDKYFRNPSLTAIHVIRERIGLPPPIYTVAPSISAFNSTFRPMSINALSAATLAELEPAESLGPLEAPFASATFRRNFSGSIKVDRYDSWNRIFKPFYLAPFTPWEPVLPTEAKFLGSSGFRPIGGGEGGTGYEFSHAIGGNSVNEQFTVVMLTYEREQVLMNALSRLYGLPYLNKVIVVWNSRDPPSQELKWPDIGVRIEVIATEKNSLNNRFIPFEAVETEAVLSIDDDAHLRHDEIIFGFRVWRENRDRLVGFPGRYHAWDGIRGWNYNSNYSCELSMVLTGAAFYHKYYSYLYTYEMPSEIRNMVDEFMNCEDLAMNFLVSHVTRKPPVKVTSRWTFRCPGCPVSLSEDDSHFTERHRCINFFTKVYGYMPLMYTQFRADSVLFKTRIPQDKQKCFKFI